MAFSAATTNTGNIPQWLRDLGVAEIHRHQSGYDLMFGFQFGDGDALWLNPYSRFSKPPLAGDEFMAHVIAAVREHRNLPPE